MARITVIPEQLRSVSSQLGQTAHELRALEGRLNNAISALDWEARQKAGIDSQVAQVRGRIRALAEQAEGLARFLVNKAEAFETADHQSADALDKIIRDTRMPSSPAHRRLLHHGLIAVVQEEARMTHLGRFPLAQTLTITC